MKKFHHFISLSRNVKRMILLLADSILLISALWISFSLRLGILLFPEKSELCLQILRRQPKLLLLFDQNEFALYTIHSELLLLLNKLFTEERQLGALALVPKLIPLLGSVQNEKRLHEVMKTWKPSVIYHTAAYKHVPLVKSNVTEGVKNNVLGTLSLVKCAIEHQVTSLVLISTDKAVRPTNIMGCTKRIAEMMLQALSEKKELEFESLGKRTILLTRKTHLSMVRFGNVLGSSGSVVPFSEDKLKKTDQSL